MDTTASITDVLRRGETPRGELSSAALLNRALEHIENRSFRVGVVGLGYVGLPLIRAFWRAGFPVTGFDIDPEKIAALNAGRSYIRHFSDQDVGAFLDSGRFAATADFARVRGLDAVIICVPTPLTRQREPDISYIVRTAEAVAPHLSEGCLAVLESTTYPGTTREVVAPILAQGGLTPGRDLFLAFSPEREDPGNPHYETATIPKVVGADDTASRTLATRLYGETVKTVVPVSSSAAAEAVKLSENIFRSVNIALVNELKVIYERMDIDVWEVIEAAKTKPFGYMAFYPGPGLGGHCIPIDPFYLAWKAREYDTPTRFIELAGEINTTMPEYVVNRLARALDNRFARGLNGARILLLGAAYKKNVDDMRESPALVLMDLLRARKAEVAYHDPLIPVLPETREHPHLAGLASVPLTAAELEGYDAVVISTDHDSLDYQQVVNWSRLVIDTRNATKAVTRSRDRIVKA